LAAGAIALTLTARAGLLFGLELRMIGHLAAHPWAGALAVSATHTHTHFTLHSHAASHTAPHAHSHAVSHAHASLHSRNLELIGLIALAHFSARALSHLHSLGEFLLKDGPTAIAKPFPDHWRNKLGVLGIALRPIHARGGSWLPDIQLRKIIDWRGLLV